MGEEHQEREEEEEEGLSGSELWDDHGRGRADPPWLTPEEANELREFLTSFQEAFRSMEASRITGHGPEDARPLERPQDVERAFSCGQVEVGTALVDHARLNLQLDPEWTVTSADGFECWLHRLRLRVTARNPRARAGATVTPVRADVEVLRDVADVVGALREVAHHNLAYPVGALVFDPERRRVSSTTAVWAHDETGWLLRIFSTATAFGIARAERIADQLAAETGGSVAMSSPGGSPRTTADEMLQVDKYLATRPVSRELGEADYEVVGRQLLALGVFATHGDTGVTAEVPFDSPFTGHDPMPAGTAIICAGHGDILVGPAVDCAYAGEQFAYRLGLPVTLDAERALRIANELNRMEAAEEVPAHLLGAWAADGGDLWFSGAVPIAALPHDESASMVVLNLMLSVAVRVRWLSENKEQLLTL